MKNNQTTIQFLLHKLVSVLTFLKKGKRGTFSKILHKDISISKIRISFVLKMNLIPNDNDPETIDK